MTNELVEVSVVPRPRFGIPIERMFTSSGYIAQVGMYKLSLERLISRAWVKPPDMNRGRCFQRLVNALAGLGMAQGHRQDDESVIEDRKDIRYSSKVPAQGILAHKAGLCKCRSA